MGSKCSAAGSDPEQSEGSIVLREAINDEILRSAQNDKEGNNG